MMDFLRKRLQEKTPYVYDITVPAILREKLGFKSKTSSFYLISDKEMKQEETPYKEMVLEDYLKSKRTFRGVYCSAAAETILDIQSDLRKYCDLTGCVGLVNINGKEEIVNPVLNLIKNQKQR